MKRLLIIFVKNPRLGAVKTRLAQGIGAAAALEVYRLLLRHTANICAPLETTIKKRVYYSDKTEKNDLWDDAIYEKHLQRGADLGQRMENAFREGFEAGFQEIVIIGSDTFELNTAVLAAAFQQLQQHDAVVGAAADGGYYLLGIKEMNAGLFCNKRWSSDEVLAATLQDLSEKSVALLPLLHDIDTPEDWQRYQILSAALPPPLS